MHDRNFSRLASALICATVYMAAMTNLSAAQAQDARSSVLSSGKSSQHRLHIVAKSSGKLRKHSSSGASAPYCVDAQGNPGTCDFQYYGGPVISNVDTVVVYWGSGVSTVVDCGGGLDSQGNCIGISRFFSSVTNSTYLDMLQEYNTAGVNASAGSHIGMPGTNQVIGRGTLHPGSPYTIAPSGPNSGTTISDSNIQNEIQNQISAGTLPAPAIDSTGNVNTLYVVYFPPGIVISDPGSVSCVDYCAYHFTFNLDARDVPYGVVPDFGTGSGCDVGCGAGTEWQNLMSASSHELGESITDTAVGIGTTVDYPLAWYDINNGEIGDPCNQNTDTLEYDATPFVVQQLLSQKAYNLNPNAGCVSPGDPIITLTVPASGVAGVPFAVTAAVGEGDGSNYLGTIHFFSSDASASLPGDYTFTAADAGTHIFNDGVTLNDVGSFTISVVDAHQASNTSTGSIAITGQHSTTTSLTSSANPSSYNQVVTFIATVSAGSGSPTGTVTFSDGSALLGSAALSNGLATLSTSGLTVGLHSIGASYSGDANFTGSNSVALSQSVVKASTSLILTTNSNPSAFGQSVTLMAAITPLNGGTATGTISFLDGTTTLGSSGVSGNAASLAINTLSVGKHSLQATYSGDGNLGASSSTILSETVSKATSTVMLTSSLNPALIGQSVTYTATALPQFTGVPTGMVTFKQGTSTIAAIPLSGGVVSFSTSYAAAGTFPIKAVYSGDGNFFASTSSILKEVINKYPVTVQLTSDVGSSVYGQTVTFTATLTTSGSTLDGQTVTFKTGTTILGTAAITSGAASLSTAALNAGNRTVTAVYSGDATHAAAKGPLTILVSKASTTTVLVSDINPSAPGQTVTLTATVGSATLVPGGTVSFKLGTTLLGTGALSGGVATLATNSIPSGSHKIVATYAATANFGSSSGSIVQKVQ
jgi:hypothetical protein